MSIFSWILDLGKSPQEYIEESIDSQYNEAMKGLNERHMTFPTHLKEYELTPEQIAQIEYGEAMGRARAHEVMSEGHSWSLNSEGNVTHCDGVPIGKCSF